MVKLDDAVHVTVPFDGVGLQSREGGRWRGWCGVCGDTTNDLLYANAVNNISVHLVTSHDLYPNGIWLIVE